jgi:uncharacterized protein
MKITPTYAAVLVLIFIMLSFRTIKLRRKHKIAVGHDDNIELLRAIRAHANFAEYVPLALLEMYMLETISTLNILIHLLGLSLIVGRVIHAYSVSQLTENIQFRVIGMMLTFAVLAIAAIGILFSSALNAFG